MLKQKRQTITLVLAITFLALPLFANAAGLVPCGGPSENPCGVQDIFYLSARVTNWLISLAGLYAVFQIVNAGFWLVTTMGNEESITKWRKALSNAVVGFALVMMAYMFVNTAVNLLLAQDKDCKKVNLASPLTYLQMNKPCK